VATRAELYAAQVAQLIEGAKALTPEAEHAIERLLAQADREILGRIAWLDPKSFTAFQLDSLRTSIDQAMAQFRTAATDKVQQLQEKAAIAATHGTSNTVAAALGTAVSLGAVNPTTLRIAQGYSADLISGLSADASAKIKGVVQRAFLGGQSLSDIIAGVGHSLDGGKFSGVFTEVGDRAMKLAVNEVLRVHSISGQARLQDLASRNAAIQKMWMHIPAARVPRITHLLADGQVVAVDKPFLVGGEELMFPRDPSGSPENTIFCHCVSVAYIDDADLYATAADRETLAKVGLKVSRGN
jgi:hypothetical protein